jgi:large subunit ribosomal protein L30e
MPPKKSKKDASNSINAKLALVMKSGKGMEPAIRCARFTFADDVSRAVTLGYRSTLKQLRSGKAKLVIIAGNTVRMAALETSDRSR